MPVVELNPDDIVPLKAKDSVKWRTPNNVKESRLRSGGEGTVEAVTDGEAWVAKKRFHNVEYTPTGIPVVNKEIEVYRAVRSLPYTCQLLGTVERRNRKGRPQLEMYFAPWCDHSLVDLQRGELGIPWFAALDDALKATQLLEWMLQSAHGLSCFHTQDAPIIHHDIKPANILIDPNTKKIIFADFGIARICADGTTAHCASGTLEYASPEQRSSAGLTNRRSDVFSLGCVLAELLCIVCDVKITDFRKWRRDDVRFIDDEIVKKDRHQQRQVRFRDNDDFSFGRDTAFATHLPSVVGFLRWMTKDRKQTTKRISNLIVSCLEEKSSNRPSASKMYGTLRELVLPFLDQAVQSQYPPPVISPPGSRDTLHQRTVEDDSDVEPEQLVSRSRHPDL
ncbi:kinase-like domain-containing protein [Gaertneriomyces semiglobifer]|nr:kinase-like domain-containing protein [Gaertneriomyces semiglobifer]